MIEYLQYIFGEQVTAADWRPPDVLPGFFHHQYRYSEIQLGEARFLAMKPGDHNLRLDAMQKHRQQIQDVYGGSVALELLGLSARQRNRLVQNKVPFIIGDTQLYLPFLGIALHEKRDPPKQAIEKMPFSTQVVFLHLYYAAQSADAQGQTVTNLADELGLSKMSVSRAVTQLKMLGLAVFDTEGRKHHVRLAEDENILEKAAPYLRSPVMNVQTIQRESVDYYDLIRAGIPALSEKTMISAGPADTGYAIDHTVVRKQKKQGASDLFVREKSAFYMDADPDLLRVEIWGYDPARFSADKSVDAVSLILSLREHEDERVQQAVTALKEQIGWYTE